MYVIKNMKINKKSGILPLNLNNRVVTNCDVNTGERRFDMKRERKGDREEKER
jgi:hypothetical protein